MTDLYREVNVRDYGALGDSEHDDAPAFQAALDTLTSQAAAGTQRSTLYIPPGVYRLCRPLTVGPFGDHAFLKLEVRGGGKHTTVLFADRYADDDILQLRNEASGYIASWTIRDVQFGPCQRAIVCDNMTYAEVVDCAFKGNGWSRDCYGIELRGNTSSAAFRGCWWYHTGNVIRSDNGAVRLNGCRIGEDAGSIWVHGDLSLVGCEFHGSNVDKNEPGGWLDMGPASVIVEGGSRLLATGCQLGNITRAFATADLPTSVILTGNTFSIDDGGALIRTRRLFGSRGASVVNNLMWFRGAGGSIWDTVGNYTARNAIIKDNRISVDPSAECYVHPSIYDAGNIVRDNVGDVEWIQR